MTASIYRPDRPARQTPSRLITPGMALFAMGLATAFEFEVVGTLSAADIVMIGSLPFLVSRRGAPALLRSAAPILILAGLWLTGAVLTDAVRGTSFEDYARGWAKIIFFSAAFTSVILLSEMKIGRLMAYFSGLAVAGIVSAIFFPNEYQRGTPWKFGYAGPIAILWLVGASLARRPRAGRQVFSPLILGALNLILNFRSMFAMLVATGAISGLVWGAQLLAASRRVVSPAFVVIFVLLCALGMWGGSGLYAQLAGSGALGLEAKHKYEYQTQGGLNPLIGGRSEALVSTRAIADSPIIGHGSWARDPYYVALRTLLLRDRGVTTQGDPFKSAYIPSHSYLLGSWVEAGLAGGVFWAVCWIMALVALILQVDIRSPATPFAAFALLQLLWNIPFSPFGADVRFYVAGELCVVLWAFKTAQSRSPPSSAALSARDPIHARS